MLLRGGSQQPVPGVRPQIALLGEPMIGHSIEIVGSMFPANSVVRLFFGTWSPNFTQVDTCSVHVVPGSFFVDATVGPNGMVRWNPQSVPGVPYFPLSPSLLSLDLGLQAMHVQSSPLTVTLSNAIRRNIGGGL